MNPAQTKTVEALRAEGFIVSARNKEIVRLVRGADKRIVKADEAAWLEYRAMYRARRELMP